MAFFPAPGVAQYTFVGTWNGLIPINTVFHVRREGLDTTSAWNAAELALTSERVEDAFQLFQPEFVNDVAYPTVRGRDLTIEDGVIIESASSFVGGSSAAPTGPLVGPLVRWTTGFAGRHNGRTFVPGIAEANIDDNGQVVSTYRTALALDAANFLTFLNAATDGTHLGPPVNLVITARLPGEGAEIRTSRVVTGANVPARAAIQGRRRL